MYHEVSGGVRDPDPQKYYQDESETEVVVLSDSVVERKSHKTITHVSHRGRVKDYSRVTLRIVEGTRDTRHIERTTPSQTRDDGKRCRC